MVGPIFAAKCHGRQHEYQLYAQTAGTVLGTLILAFIGAWRERRRRVVVHQEDSHGGDP